MFTNMHLSLLLFFFVLLSKEFIIFNEEILVLAAFVFFSRIIVISINQVITAELSLRKDKIKENCNFFKELQKKTLLYILKYNEKQTKLGFYLNKSATIINAEILYLAMLYTKTFNSVPVFNCMSCLNFSNSIASSNAILRQSHLFRGLYNFV